jgi:hypothetical protein
MTHYLCYLFYMHAILSLPAETSSVAGAGAGAHADADAACTGSGISGLSVVTWPFGPQKKS